MLLRLQELIVRELQESGASFARPVCSAELGTRLRVSPSYVRELVRPLVAVGLVRVRRGRGGGYFMNGVGQTHSPRPRVGRSQEGRPAAEDASETAVISRRKELISTIASLWALHFGKGPRMIRVDPTAPGLRVTLSEILTPMEKTLLRSSRNAALVTRLRQEAFEAIGPELAQQVERLAPALRVIEVGHQVDVRRDQVILTIAVTPIADTASSS